jgi:hypothetical protein
VGGMFRIPVTLGSTDAADSPYVTGEQGAGKLASPVREETEKDPAKGNWSAVDFTRREVRGNGPGAIPAPRPGPTQRTPSARQPVRLLAG